MNPTIGSDLTIQDKRDKIRSQLYYELGLPETPRNKNIKSKKGLSKKAKFLADPRNKREPGEKSLSEMDPMKRSR